MEQSKPMKKTKKSSSRASGKTSSTRYKIHVYYRDEDLIRELAVSSRRTSIKDIMSMAFEKAEKNSWAEEDVGLFLSSANFAPDGRQEEEMDPKAKLSTYMPAIAEGALVVFKARPIPVLFKREKTFLIERDLSCADAVAWMAKKSGVVLQYEPGCGSEHLFELEEQLRIAPCHQVLVSNADEITPEMEIANSPAHGVPVEEMRSRGAYSDQLSVKEVFNSVNDDCPPAVANLTVIVRDDEALDFSIPTRGLSGSSTDESRSCSGSPRLSVFGSPRRSLAVSASSISKLGSSSLPGSCSDMYASLSRSGSDLASVSRGARSPRAAVTATGTKRRGSCTDTTKNRTVRKTVSRQVSMSCSPPRGRRPVIESPVTGSRRKQMNTHSVLSLNPDSLPVSPSTTNALGSSSPRDLFKRLSTMMKKKETKAAYKVFGVSLESVMERSWELGFFPFSLEHILSWLTEMECWKTKGIFRLSGSHAAVVEVKERLDTGIGAQLRHEDDVVVVGEVLKSYFQELPEPVVPRRLLRNFINAASLESEEHFLKYYNALLASLPSSHREALRGVVRLLAKVAKESEANSMTAENLGICFGPILFQPNDMNIEEYIHHSTYCSKVVQAFINHLPRLFDPEARPIVSARARTSYKAEQLDEVDTREGDIVTIIEKRGSSWFGDLDGRFGLFPNALFEQEAPKVSPRTLEAVAIVPAEYHMASDEMFLARFSCTKDIFICLPNWKQRELVLSCSVAVSPR